MREEAVGIGRRFLRELVPTPAQGLGSVFIAMCVLVAVQAQQIFSRLGISDQAITATRDQLTTRFSVILQSNITANLALVTFWAAVGLVAYLICWGIYNLLVEARNEVTIETQYTNHGHWRGPLETLLLKAIAATTLVVYTAVFFKYALSWWLALSATLLDALTVETVLMALAAVIGMAIQLYILLLLAQLTITPWYRPEAFTD